MSDNRPIGKARRRLTTGEVEVVRKVLGDKAVQVVTDPGFRPFWKAKVDLRKLKGIELTRALAGLKIGAQMASDDLDYLVERGMEIAGELERRRRLLAEAGEKGIPDGEPRKRR
jgi:hypothetical protein